jgi:alpha-beta hydrolase superfamily lysophospholipase
MIEESHTQHAVDGWKLATYRWAKDSKPPRAVILLSHGMGEHATRYRSSLRPLIDAGCEIFAIDHRGHGASVASQEELGDLGPGGFGAVVSDLAQLARSARAARPNAPIILLGHSMGSMAAQLFLLRHPELIDAMALSGSSAVDQLANAMLADPLLLTKLNTGFEPVRTPFDWLSRSSAEVDKYIADPLCGFALRPASFASWFGFAQELADAKSLANIPKRIPIYVFSGDLDPLNHLIRGLTPVINRYKQAGLTVTSDIYPGARHEILNEENRSEVLHKLSAWIANVLDTLPNHHNVGG